jgi:hypothetical protein
MSPRSGRRRRSFALALVFVGAAVASWPSVTSLLRRWLGPPEVSAAEAYSNATAGAVFDNSRLDALLRTHVDADGLVDYEGLGRDGAALDAYLSSVASAPFVEMGRDEKLALLVNAYNAFTLRLVLDHWPVASIKEIPSGKRWDDAAGVSRARR